MRFTEMMYHLKMFRHSATVSMDDRIALASILHRLDNLESFLEYLRQETFDTKGEAHV